MHPEYSVPRHHRMLLYSTNLHVQRLSILTPVARQGAPNAIAVPLAFHKTETLPGPFSCTWQRQTFDSLRHTGWRKTNRNRREQGWRQTVGPPALGKREKMAD